MNDPIETSADRELFDELRQAAEHDPADVETGLEESLRQRYSILGEIHRGGQGTVLRAVDLRTDGVVALKVLPQGRRASLKERYRFEREVDLAASLDHPNIVRVHEGCAVDGHIFYVMDLIDGKPLDKYWSECEPDRRKRLQLFQKICGAVTYAHQRGVIHRDLKPQNILVDARGEPHVLDFGLAKGTGNERVKLTMTGEFMGTLAYAAPEQLSGRRGAVDIRTDVYSLGVILYEMLTDNLPYDVRGGLGAVIQSISTTPPRDVPPTCMDTDLRTLVHKALSKDADRRYQSADALSQDIGHYLADEPIEARRDSSWYIARKWFVRQRRSVGLGVGALVLVGSVVAAVVLRDSERRQRITSQEISELFRQTLTDAPMQLGADATTQMLDQTVSQLHDSLSDSPEVKATLHLTVGDMYRRLMMIDEARPSLRSAVDLFTEIHGPDHLEVARALDLLGQAATVRSTPEAVTSLERALDIRTRALGDRHALTAITKRHLAEALQARYYQPDPVRAERLATEALAVLQQLYDEDHLEVALTRHRLDILTAGRLDGAELERRLKRNLEVFRREASTDELPAITGLNDYSRFLIDSRRFEEAEMLLQESTRLMEKAWGSRQVPDLLWRFGRFEFTRGNLEAARRLYRESLSLQLGAWESRGSEHGQQLESLRNALAGGGEPPFRETFDLLIELEGVGRYELAGDMNDVADLLAAMDLAPAAEILLEDSLVIRCREFGLDCPHRASNLLALGVLLLQREAWPEAVGRLGEVYEICVRAGQLNSLRGARTSTALAAGLMNTGELARAEQLLVSAYGVFQGDLDANLADAVTNLRLLQEVLTARGEAERAEVVGAKADELAKTLQERSR